MCILIFVLSCMQVLNYRLYDKHMNMNVSQSLLHSFKREKTEVTEGLEYYKKEYYRKEKTIYTASLCFIFRLEYYNARRI